MSSLRVTVHERNNPSSGAKLLIIPPNTSLDGFLQAAGLKLSSTAVKAYLSNGGEIDDIHLIRDNDVIYIQTENNNANSAVSNSSSSTASNPKQGSIHMGTEAPTAAKKSHYSIAVMGAGAVGKSALTLRYVQGIFVKDYDPTIEDAYRKSVTINGSTCTLDILDTAGQEDYVALRSTWMRERDAFVLVFSLTDKTSLDALAAFYEQLISMHEEKLPPLLIVGNKSDLIAKRVIQQEEGKKLSASYSNSPYLETSAATGENVEKIFEVLVEKIRQDQGFYSGGHNNGSNKKKSSSWCNIL
jgi:GTPase KRas protein